MGVHVLFTRTRCTELGAKSEDMGAYAAKTDAPRAREIARAEPADPGADHFKCVRCVLNASDAF